MKAKPGNTMSQKFLALVSFILAAVSSLQAADTPSDAARIAEAAVKAAKAAEKVDADARAEMADESFKGLGFGAGIGAIFDVGGAKRVKNASVDPSGIVRVQSDDSVRVGALLETHYLWGFDSGAKAKRVFYHGPQIALVLGENVVDGIGLGYMVALRRKNPA